MSHGPLKNTAGIVSAENPKGGGRPVGSGRRGGKRWQPSQWKPLYDQIIALKLAGYEHKKIAGLLKISIPQINNIVNCDEGLRIRAEAIKKLRGVLMGTIDERMDQIVAKTISRTHQLISDDAIFAKAPVTAIKTAIALGRATGHFKADASEGGNSVSINSKTTINNNSTVNVIGEGGVDIIKRAMAGSDEARRLNDGAFKNPVKVIEASVPVEVK